MNDLDLARNPERLEIFKSDGPLDIQNAQIFRQPKAGARGQLTGSVATLYTAPAVVTPTGSNQGALLKSIHLYNGGAATRTVTLYFIEGGGDVAADRAFVTTVAAGQWVMLEFPDETFPLDSGETVRGFASVTAEVTYRINVVELTS